MYEFGCFKKGASLLEDAWKFADSNAKGAGNVLCMWKLNGDIQLYREEGKKKLARLAFDSARSIDPSLALPWAGMAADAHPGECAKVEAFESILRALAEFQIGLAKLSFLSGNLVSSQVYGAIRQAVLRAPQCPESHYLKGFVCEARSEYQIVVASYRLALNATKISSAEAARYYLPDIRMNLARSLCRAGQAEDAIRECESLKREGMFRIMHT
ncbi:Tetratricopeptide repeat (TPR)-like superfamily protein [Euphorbia peplus]|nr:Tetratricopeptide repeat (TPR)-like superfamily protein [Euphorbia peplus]